MNKKETESDFPFRLYDLCIQLGIVKNRSSNPSKATASFNTVSEDIFNFLANLPNANSMDEKMWLKTPELWAFANFSEKTICNTKSGIDIQEEIEKNKESWCDAWICAGNFNKNTFCRISSPYLIPYMDYSKISSLSGKTKWLGKSMSFIPKSQMYKNCAENNFSSKAFKEAKGLKGQLPLGFLSFHYNIPLATLIAS